MVRDSVLVCLGLPLRVEWLLKLGSRVRGRFVERPRKRKLARTKWPTLIT